MEGVPRMPFTGTRNRFQQNNTMQGRSPGACRASYCFCTVVARRIHRKCRTTEKHAMRLAVPSDKKNARQAGMKVVVANQRSNQAPS